jgi:sialate O-acetylesterase
MARELRASTKVPIGLIDASWGGTAINSWRSETAIAAAGDSAEPLKIVQTFRRDPAEGNRAWGRFWEAWWLGKTGNPADRPWNPMTAEVGPWAPVPSLTAWESWGEPSLATFDGMLWYRTRVTLTAEQAAMPATLSAGWIDEVDQSWVNGVAVGNSYGPGSNRVYAIPANVLKAGANMIVINALDTYGAGGLVGPPELRAIRLADGSSIPLSGGWEYRPVPKSVGNPPRAPWETNAGLSTIYNGMIAPLGGYGLRGVAWYQGESDADGGRGYAARLTNMMADWRSQFAAPTLPFLIVQLSSWGAIPDAPVENGFATIRDEQRRAVAADPHAGLVVAVDLGDRDLHPPNKQDVGRRLARAARHVAYGEALTPSGPEVAGVRRGGDAVVVDFRNVDGRLVSYSAAHPIGFELCGPATGSCRFVDGAINGTTVTLIGATAADTRVRFCWGASPICNLYDTAGLAAGPFEEAVR